MPTYVVLNFTRYLGHDCFEAIGRALSNGGNTMPKRKDILSSKELLLCPVLDVAVIGMFRLQVSLGYTRRGGSLAKLAPERYGWWQLARENVKARIGG